MAHPNEYNKAGADFVNLTNINGTEAFLLANLQPCQSGIANDTNAFVFADKDGNKYVARPVDALTTGCVPKKAAVGLADSLITEDTGVLSIGAALKANQYGAYVGANPAEAQHPSYFSTSLNALFSHILRHDGTGNNSIAGYDIWGSSGGEGVSLQSINAGVGASGLVQPNSVRLYTWGKTNGLRIYTQDDTPVIIGSANTKRIQSDSTIAADVSGTVRCTELVTTPKQTAIVVGNGVFNINPNGYAVIYVSGYTGTASDSPYGLLAGTFDGQRLTLINSGSGADRLRSAYCGSAAVIMWLNGMAKSSIDFKYQNMGESIELIWSAWCTAWVVNSATGTYNA